MEEKEPLKEISVNFFLNDDQKVISEVEEESQVNDEKIDSLTDDKNKEAGSKDQESFFDEEAENNGHQNCEYSKRAKTKESLEKLRALTKKVRPRTKKNESRCKSCEQKLTDYKLKLYNGHPNDAVDEYLVLIDEKLSLFSGDEENIIQNDMRATNKITMFR